MFLFHLTCKNFIIGCINQIKACLTCPALLYEEVSHVTRNNFFAKEFEGTVNIKINVFTYSSVGMLCKLVDYALTFQNKKKAFITFKLFFLCCWHLFFPFFIILNLNLGYYDQNTLSLQTINHALYMIRKVCMLFVVLNADKIFPLPFFFGHYGV